MGWAGVVFHSGKWKKDKNSTHSKIKFYIILIFFYTLDIKYFLKCGGKEEGRAGQGWVEFFFYILLYNFINVMIKTLYIGSFIVVNVIYFTHSLYSCVLRSFCFLLKNYTFLQEIIFSHSFWPWWLKQTSFYRELNTLDLRRHFCFSIRFQ